MAYLRSGEEARRGGDAAERDLAVGSLGGDTGKERHRGGRWGASCEQTFSTPPTIFTPMTAPRRLHPPEASGARARRSSDLIRRPRTSWNSAVGRRRLTAWIVPAPRGSFKFDIQLQPTAASRRYGSAVTAGKSVQGYKTYLALQLSYVSQAYNV